MSAQGNPKCPSQTGMWMSMWMDVDEDAVIVADLPVHVSKKKERKKNVEP